MLTLLIFIIDYKKLSNNVLINKIQMFKRDYQKLVIIMKIRYEKHVRKLTKNYINIVKAYKILKKIHF